MEIAINQLLSCDGPPQRSKETAGGRARSPAQPSPAQPSPPLPSPTPSTSTCSRRAAKAKARGKSPRTMAKFCQVDGSRTRLVWLVGGRGVEGMACATAGPAFIGLCRTQETTSGAVPAQQYAECSEEHTVKASASTPYSLPNARAGSLL